MADVFDKATRSRIMASIKPKNTKIEWVLRRALRRKGHRYKTHHNTTGKPDIAFPSLKIAIFCDSEFWHGYNWQVNKKKIKSHKLFWTNKIEKNIKRDKHVNHELKKEGWLVLRFWGRDITKKTALCVSKIENALKKRQK